MDIRLYDWDCTGKWLDGLLAHEMGVSDVIIGM